MALGSHSLRGCRDCTAPHPRGVDPRRASSHRSSTLWSSRRSKGCASQTPPSTASLSTDWASSRSAACFWTTWDATSSRRMRWACARSASTPQTARVGERSAPSPPWSVARRRSGCSVASASPSCDPDRRLTKAVVMHDGPSRLPCSRACTPRDSPLWSGAAHSLVHKPLAFCSDAILKVRARGATLY
jgi:hypothetical protein